MGRRARDRMTGATEGERQARASVRPVPPDLTECGPDCVEVGPAGAFCACGWEDEFPTEAVATRAWVDHMERCQRENLVPVHPDTLAVLEPPARGAPPVEMPEGAARVRWMTLEDLDARRKERDRGA